MKTPYPHLFSPLQIRGLMLKNRIIAAPMGIIPSHKIISSVNYGGMSALDRSLGGCAMVHTGGMNHLDKYELDTTVEDSASPIRTERGPPMNWNSFRCRMKKALSAVPARGSGLTA